MQFRLSILLLLIPCSLHAIPRQSITQEVKDIQVERYMVQAMTKSFLGQREEAIELYKKALGISPSSAVISASISEEYEKLDNLPTAVYYAIQAKDLAPEDPLYHKQLAKLYLQQNDIAAAEKTLQNMRALFPENVEALEDLAFLQFSSAQYEKSLASYKALERRLGSQQRISYRLLQIYFELDDVEGMEAALIEMEKQDPTSAAIKRNLAELYVQYERKDEAIQILEAALAIDSSDVETIVPLAQLYEAQNNKPRADALWELAMQASGSPEDAFSRASHLYERAAEHLETVDVVVKLLEYAIGQDPEYLEAIVLLGTIRFEEQRYDEAGAMLYKAVQINPRNPELWLQSSAAYLHLNKPGRAAEIADEALMLFPGQISLLRVAAYGYMDSYQNNLSIKRFLEFYTLSKTDPAKRSEVSEILSALGLLYTRIKDFEASDSSYAAAIKISPDNAVVLNNLAYSLAERNLTLDKALNYANRAVKIDASNPSFMDTLGWVYFKRGEFENAERWVARAIKAGAQTATIYEHLGDVQAKLGKQEDAVAAWSKSLEMNPDNPILKEKINNYP